MKKLGLLGLSVLLIFSMSACKPKQVEVENVVTEEKVEKTEVISKEEVKEETIYNLTEEDRQHREDRLTGKYKWYLDNRKLADGVPYFETYAFFERLGDEEDPGLDRSGKKVEYKYSEPVEVDYTKKEDLLSWHDLIALDNELPSVTEVYLDKTIKLRAIKNFKESNKKGYFLIETIGEDGKAVDTFNFSFEMKTGVAKEYIVTTTLDELSRFQKVFNSKAAGETLSFLKDVLKVEEQKTTEKDKAESKTEVVEKETDDSGDKEPKDKISEEKSTASTEVVISNVDLEKSDEYLDNETDTAFVKALVSFIDERGFFALGEQMILIGEYNYYEGESNNVAPNSYEVVSKKSDLEIEKWRAGLRAGLSDTTELFTGLIKTQNTDYSNTKPTMERIELTKDKVGDSEIVLSRFEFRYNTQNRSDAEIKKGPRQVTIVKTKLKPNKIVQ